MVGVGSGISGFQKTRKLKMGKSNKNGTATMSSQSEVGDDILHFTGPKKGITSVIICCYCVFYDKNGTLVLYFLYILLLIVGFNCQAFAYAYTNSNMFYA